MIYTVKRIEEDIDFGCEERAEGTPVMAVVVLEDSDGQETSVRMEDQLLYDRGINEGDRVYFDEKNKLARALEGDWTKNCTARTINTAAFVERMEAVKEGKATDWKCPFCGGNVGLIEQDEVKTVIGCDSCDMRINLESNQGAE